MADYESLSTHWGRSPAEGADLDTRRDFGCRLLTVDHGRVSAPAAASHAMASPAPSLVARRLDRFLAGHPGAPTPFLVVDLDVVRRQYASLATALPGAEVFYAVKANPAPEVLRLLIRLGSHFDVASRGEIELCLGLGADPARLSYGNTVKKERDIAAAYRCGVRLFTVDSRPELDKVLRTVASGTVFVRIVTDGAGADWPLSRKFGCTVGEAGPLLLQAARAGLQVGVSFHVGSQQRNPAAWDRPLSQVAHLARLLMAAGHELGAVNLGGGLPSRHVDPTADIETYGEAIAGSVAAHLGPRFGGLMMVEPGRYLVGDAGVIRTEVVQIVRRASDPDRRWVFLDVGLFNGLTETLDEAIRYRIQAPGHGSGTGPVVLAGPSCDSADVLYETYQYQLPLDLQVGDHLEILGTGAYTSSYSSVGFNGFPPLPSYYLPATSGSGLTS
jgi:ornithine decarboxylase